MVIEVSDLQLWPSDSGKAQQKSTSPTLLLLQTGPAALAGRAACRSETSSMAMYKSRTVVCEAYWGATKTLFKGPTGPV